MDRVDKLQNQINFLQRELKNKQNEENVLQKKIIELREEKDSQIKVLREEKDSQIKGLREEKIQTDYKLEKLMKDKKNIDSQVQLLENNEQKSKKENKILKENMAELQKRMDKIDLRDTIKLCIKYLYKILRSKFKETDEVNYFGMRLRKLRKY